MRINEFLNTSTLASKTALGAWIAYTVCSRLVNTKTAPGFITPDSFDIVQSGAYDIDISINAAQNNMCYIPPEMFSGGEYDYRSALFGVGLTIFEAITGKSFTEAQGISAEDFPFYIGELDRATLVRADDEALGVFAPLTALLTSTDPDKRIEGAEAAAALIEEYNCDIEVEFIRNGEEASKGYLMLESAGETARISDALPDGAELEGEDAEIEYRPWKIAVKAVLKNTEPLNYDPLPPTEEGEEVVEFGILVCPEDSSIPEMFYRLGSSANTDSDHRINVKLYDDTFFEVHVYVRDARHPEADSCYRFPKLLIRKDVVTLGPTNSDEDAVLVVKTKAAEDNKVELFLGVEGHYGLSGSTVIDFELGKD